MNKALLTSGTILLLAAGSAFADDASATAMNSSTNSNNDSGSYWHNGDLYRANELSLDAFGTDSLGHYAVDHPSGHRISHDSRLGAGLGVNYFFLKYVGVGGEAYTENTSHNFVDDTDGYLKLRLPIGNTGLAPYIIGGGGYKFDPVGAAYYDGGVGLEFRFTPHIGMFVDARYVNANHIHDYGLGRAGITFAF
jgi:hypothetical protein